MIRDTSLKAYDSISHRINPQQKLILKTVQSRKDMTRQEISKATGLPINVVSGRCTEMRDYGCLDELRKRKCRVTGMKVWALSA